MKNKVYAIGDIHGHFDQFLRLYKQLLKDGFSPKKDTLVLLGDFVDGGSQVKELIDWLIKMKKSYPHWQMLYGNHEDLMLDALVYNGRIYGSYDLWWNQGGKETFQSYVDPSLSAYEKAISQVEDHIPIEHLDFLRNLPIYYEEDGYFFIHAGLVPGFTLDRWKAELEGKDRDTFRQDSIWIRDQFIQSEYDWGKKIIFGHTTFKKPFIMDNKIGIDGMFHNTGQMFAIKLPEEKIFIEKA